MLLFEKTLPHVDSHNFKAYYSCIRSTWTSRRESFSNDRFKAYLLVIFEQAEKIIVRVGNYSAPQLQNIKYEF